MNEKFEIIKEEFEDKLKFANEYNCELDRKSWGYEEGHLLTFNEVKFLIDTIQSLTSETERLKAELEYWREYADAADTIACNFKSIGKYSTITEQTEFSNWVRLRNLRSLPTCPKQPSAPETNVVNDKN